MEYRGPSIVIPVRVGSQSRVFTISRTGRTKLLEDRILREWGFANGKREVITILYFPSCLRAYHGHEVGKSWVPTAPGGVVGRGLVWIRPLSTSDFVSHLPQIVLNNVLLKRWFPEETRLSRYCLRGERMAIKLSQCPEIEGMRSFEIAGKVVRPLSFLNGSAVLEFAMNDYFGLGRRLRIYHNGRSNAKVGLQHSARFDSVNGVAFDGVRMRFLYRSNRSGMQVATSYQSNPSGLFSLSSPEDDARTRLLIRELAPDFALGVTPTRNLEWMMLDHGSAYDHGIIGAEIAHLVASRMLMTDQLIISEPAKGGADLDSRDGSIAIEARMLTRTRCSQYGSLVTETLPHMKQMMRKVRWELSKRAHSRGLAILSLQLQLRNIVALVKEA